jgi:hypothetical protein
MLENVASGIGNWHRRRMTMDCSQVKDGRSGTKGRVGCGGGRTESTPGQAIKPQPQQSWLATGAARRFALGLTSLSHFHCHCYQRTDWNERYEAVTMTTMIRQWRGTMGQDSHSYARRTFTYEHLCHNPLNNDFQLSIMTWLSIKRLSINQCLIKAKKLSVKQLSIIITFNKTSCEDARSVDARGVDGGAMTEARLIEVIRDATTSNLWDRLDNIPLNAP